MKPRLLAISGSLAGTVRELADGQISIGRDEANQLCLIDPTVSRKHCAIRQADGQFELIDLDSRCGTFVNGMPVGRKLLDHGDSIRMGGAEFVFLMHEGEGIPVPKMRRSGFSSSLSDTVRMAVPAGQATFGVEVGRMARDLTALFRISNVINSIRNSQLLQHELLRLIFEVVPAEEGAVVLLTDLEETSATCTWSRKLGADAKIDVQREIDRKSVV